MLRKLHSPVEVWKILKTAFQAVSEAAIDAKLSKLHAIQL